MDADADVEVAPCLMMAGALPRMLVSGEW
jgi:hypothetical protein